MQLKFILKTRAADWVILQLMTSIDRKTRDFEDFYYKYLCIIKEQRSYHEECKWKRKKGCHNNVNDKLCQIQWLHIVDTGMAKWASTERQRFLVMRSWISRLRYVVVSHTRILVCLYRQNRFQYPPCLIMKMSVNGVSTICGPASCEITSPIGCRQSYRNFWQPL